MTRPIENVKPPMVALKHWCATHHVTQNELASILGVSRDTVSKHASYSTLPTPWLWMLYGIGRLISPKLGRPQETDSRRSDKRIVNDMLTIRPEFFLEDGTPITFLELEASPGGMRYWRQEPDGRALFARAHDPKYCDSHLNGPFLPVFARDAK